MSSYESFAQVYDLFMEDTPYNEWAEYICKIWSKHSKEIKLVADLGCGTGNITQLLADKGYDMIGIDISEPMLAKAIEKANQSGSSVLYLNQDMRAFELYGTVDSIISVCDSINYITEEDDLLQVFKLVNNYLDPDGLFIFDINTIYKFENILGCNSFSQTTENSAYTWENYYDEEEGINEFYTNFFILDEESGQYNRYEEYHYEKGWSIEKITELLEKAGLKLLNVYDENSFNPPTATSQRIYFVAQEVTKNKEK